jgi:hypothetical protein
MIQIVTPLVKDLSHVDCNTYQGRIQDFKLEGAHLTKLRRAEGVFGVKKHDFTPKNHIFFNCREHFYVVFFYKVVFFYAILNFQMSFH